MRVKLKIGENVVQTAEIKTEEEIYSIAMQVGKEFGMKKIVLDITETDDGIEVQILPYNLGG